MWLSLLIALVTYLLSPNDTASQRRQALINAGIAGGGTYLATEYTDWGRDLSDSFDDAIGVPQKAAIPTNGNSIDAAGREIDSKGDIVTEAKIGTIGGPNKTAASGGSLWTTLSSWGPETAALVGGVTGLALSSGSGWLLLGAGALLLYTLAK